MNGAYWAARMQEHEGPQTEEDAEFYHWFYKEDQVEHECEGCSTKFSANACRGALAYCDNCADRIEQGFDVGY